MRLNDTIKERIIYNNENKIDNNNNVDNNHHKFILLLIRSLLHNV